MSELQKQPTALIKHIEPFWGPLSGEIILPGSKSITNRALILSALSVDTVTIRNALISDDTLVMADALKSLGFSIEIDMGGLNMIVEGCSGKIPNSSAFINVGNAGTVARFLTAMLCLHPEGTYYLDGSECMRNRPMKELLDCLEVLGAATVTYHEKIGHFPFTLNTHGLSGGEIIVDASKSSQVLSALLHIAPLSSSPLIIKLAKKVVSLPYVKMTVQMMKEFGQTRLSGPEDEYSFPAQSPYKFFPKFYHIEPDLTSASYFFALNLIVGGRLNFSGLTSMHSLQGDIAFTQILQAYGLKIEKSSTQWSSEFKEFSLINTQEFDFNAISDTFLTLAAIAPLFKVPIRISGIAHTRYQETDRIAAVSNELRKLNQNVVESQNSITIIPGPLRPAIIDTYGDHRIAMSFAILGSYDLFNEGQPWISINDPGCCTKSFPKFFDILDKLRNNSCNIKKKKVYA